MTKYLIDTNVILNDPEYLIKTDKEVVLSVEVINELDRKKSSDGIIGYNARKFARLLVESSKTFKFDRAEKGDLSVDDHLIALSKKMGYTLLTNDNYMNIKARMNGVVTAKVAIDNKDMDYSGVINADVTDDQIQQFNEHGEIWLTDEQISDMQPNEIVILNHKESESAVGFAIYKGGSIAKRVPVIKELRGIGPKNKEQGWLMSLTSLLSKKNGGIDLLTIEGCAGSGKTLIALAAALELVESGAYETITLTKPLAAMGNQGVGYLKGSYKDKIMPFMQSYIDILEKLDAADMDMLVDEVDIKYGERKSPIKFDALTFIRGRNLKDIIILDEAASLNQHEVRSLLTRADEGAKIIMIADTDQIDVPYVNKYNNGFTYMVNMLKHHDFTAHIRLLKSERSRLAEAAGKV